MRLIKPDGIVGLLTPSGIYADKTAARFFKSVSTSGRVSGLFRFRKSPNSKQEEHLSSPTLTLAFKFCALIFGGEKRRFDETECAFFLHDTAAIHDPSAASRSPLPTSPASTPTPAPPPSSAPAATPTSPAASTSAIPYSSTAPAMKRSARGPCKVPCNVHMTGDSHLFRTAAQLEADGFYPVQGNRWKRADELYLPLYQGSMIWHSTTVQTPLRQPGVH